MTFETQVVVSPRTLPNPISLFHLSLFHRIWPLAAVGVALIANTAWIGFLGYELYKLAF
jgi:hypothetical protein